MPTTTIRIPDPNALVQEHYASTPVCCPSRTGALQYTMRNHGIQTHTVHMFEIWQTADDVGVPMHKSIHEAMCGNRPFQFDVITDENGWIRSVSQARPIQRTQAQKTQYRPAAHLQQSPMFAQKSVQSKRATPPQTKKQTTLYTVVTDAVRGLFAQAQPSTALATRKPQQRALPPPYTVDISEDGGQSWFTVDDLTRENVRA